jgi:hypothetical protein
MASAYAAQQSLILQCPRGQRGAARGDVLPIVERREGDEMQNRRWTEIVSAGSLVGLAASVFMTLVMALLSHGLGVATPVSTP